MSLKEARIRSNFGLRVNNSVSKVRPNLIERLSAYAPYEFTSERHVVLDVSERESTLTIGNTSAEAESFERGVN